MGYKPKQEKKRTLEEIAGVRIIALPAGKRVRIRVFALKDLWQLEELMGDAFFGRNNKGLARLFQWILSDTNPGILIKCRRFLGMPDFSIRVMKGMILDERVVRALLDAALEANLNTDLKRLLEALGASAEKKSGGDSSNGTDWGQIMSGLFTRAGVLPGDAMEMSLVQLTTLIEHINSIENETAERDTLDALKRQYGGRLVRRW